ncbi:MAG: hypothetical protein LBU66_06250 [Treponema sp.]|jgi:chromosome segregation ATPase|nr:hypothetical protein [Treponema sp.]
MSNNEIVFDAKSGISIEEQQEILLSINKIAEKNLQSFSESSRDGAQKREMQTINAKKSGSFFPFIVNIAAIIILCGGALFLVLNNSKIDSEVKTGTAVYNIAERALIDEIRKDTSEKIAAKEQEMALITSHMEEVDAQLLQLYSSNEELNAEQLAARQELLAIQASYWNELEGLQEERSRILEDSRSREARLRSQLEERAREYAAAQARTAGELDSAIYELERLANEQDRIAAIDAQLAGGLASVSDLVKDGYYDEAAQTIGSLRQFVNNNTYSRSRSFQAKREIYNQAIDSMDQIVDEMCKFVSANSEGLDLLRKNSELEEAITEMQKSLDGYTAGSSGQARRLGELEDTVSTLRKDITSLETNITEKDTTIVTMTQERAALTQEKDELTKTVTDLQTITTEQEQELTKLNEQLTTIQQIIQRGQ